MRLEVATPSLRDLCICAKNIECREAIVKSCRNHLLLMGSRAKFSYDAAMFRRSSELCTQMKEQETAIE
uniref:Uncharacterized protein n=1 Tax=Caenorhabditis japonica TaxID=281687 RepID=A0A8R1IVP0_CAEJA